jgi:hypothetical protein
VECLCRHSAPALMESLCAPRLMIGVTDHISTHHIQSSVSFFYFLDWIYLCVSLSIPNVFKFFSSVSYVKSVQPTETLHHIR